MELIPPRTYASNLDDDELILFDFLWDCHAAEKFLYSDIICIHANTPYSHSIPDDQLHSRLVDLVHRNLLTTYDHRNQQVFEKSFHLTQKGLEIWESERLPNWSRFIIDSWYDNELTVTAITKEIGIEFINVCRKCGLWNIGTSEPIHRIETSIELIPHKIFDEVHYFSFQNCLNDFIEVDWSFYENNRIWWRGTSELQISGASSV